MRFALVPSLVLAVTVAVAQAKTPPSPSSPQFADVVHDHFEAWDLDHDGKLEAREIDTLMTKRSIHGDAAAALAVLKLRERRTPASIRKGFTLTSQDVDGLDSLTDDGAAIDPAKGPPKPFHSETQFRRYRKTLQTLVPKLYAGEGPDFSVMKQGPIGDCYFFCMTGYLALKHPNKIRHMIQSGPNGNYTVQFLDGETFPVSAPTEAELLINNSSSSLSDGIWLCVLEKAIGERLRKISKDPAKRTAEPTDAMAFGGSTAAVMTLYSGHKAKVIKLREPKQASARLQELRHDLSVTLAHGRMVGLEMGAHHHRPAQGSGPRLPPRVRDYGLRCEGGQRHGLEPLGSDLPPQRVGRTRERLRGRARDFPRPAYHDVPGLRHGACRDDGAGHRRFVRSQHATSFELVGCPRSSVRRAAQGRFSVLAGRTRYCENCPTSKVLGPSGVSSA